MGRYDRGNVRLGVLQAESQAQSAVRTAVGGFARAAPPRTLALCRTQRSLSLRQWEEIQEMLLGRDSGRLFRRRPFRGPGRTLASRALGASKSGPISLLMPKIPLYTAPSHTETWLKRPSGGSRAIRLVCSHVS